MFKSPIKYNMLDVLFTLVQVFLFAVIGFCVGYQHHRDEDQILVTQCERQLDRPGYCKIGAIPVISN